ncbi:MAG: antibiotic biosynthesis monooxygenase [Mycobacterium sp.]|jgi:heme-degrading monooxygenase HmoA|nr:antibiotic biosynthesis monooxygenase [Mycobacterium sp.]
MVIVVFRSRLRLDADLAALEAVGARMYELGTAMPGFVDYKEFAAEDGETLTLVEFETEEKLLAWRNHPEHVEVQARARAEFFTEYAITVSEMRRAYHFNPTDGRVQTLGESSGSATP